MATTPKKERHDPLGLTRRLTFDAPQNTTPHRLLSRDPSGLTYRQAPGSLGLQETDTSRLDELAPRFLGETPTGFEIVYLYRLRPWRRSWPLRPGGNAPESIAHGSRISRGRPSSRAGRSRCQRPTAARAVSSGLFYHQARSVVR